MPTTAKGANVYRASQGNHTQVVSESPELEDNEESKGESEAAGQPSQPKSESCVFWSPSPPPKAHSESQSPTPLSFGGFAPSHKRKHAALSAPSAVSTPSTPSTSFGPKHSKQARKEITGSAALQGLTAELSAFGQIFLEGTSSARLPLPSLAPSPSRKTKAIQRAQELEEELDDDRLAALIRVFQADVSAADAYLVIKRDGLRKAWIASTLRGI
jgi:hypothetical protein